MFFQDEARFPFLRRRDLWGVLNLITKIRAFFCNCQQTFIPKKLSHFHILMFLSCEKLVSSNFPQQKIRRYISIYIYIYFVYCILFLFSKLTSYMERKHVHLCGSISGLFHLPGVSPLQQAVTLATNRPTWKSTMVATRRAAGCVPAYRDGQVDCGMDRRDIEGTGASASFWVCSFWGEGALFFLCFVVVGRGDSAGLAI